MTVEEIKTKIDEALTLEEPTERTMKLADVKHDIDLYKAERDGTEAEKDSRIAELEGDVANRDNRITELEESNRRICEKYTAQIIEQPAQNENDEDDVILYDGLIKNFDTV